MIVINQAKKKHFLTYTLIVICFIALIVMLFSATQNYFKMSYPQKYREIVTKYSSEYNVNPNLVYAIIRTESGFKQDAQSHKNARGLMQLTEPTYDWVKMKLNDNSSESYDDMYDPELNIKYGTYLIAMLLDEFDYIKTALAAYNAGRGIVNKWLTDETYSNDNETLHYIPYKETEGYVKKVYHALEVYTKLYQ